MGRKKALLLEEQKDTLQQFCLIPCVTIEICQTTSPRGERRGQKIGKKIFLFDPPEKKVLIKVFYRFPSLVESKTTTNGPAITINNIADNCKIISKFINQQYFNIEFIFYSIDFLSAESGKKLQRKAFVTSHFTLCYKNPKIFNARQVCQLFFSPLAERILKFIPLLLLLF
eukprot:TRINITY_DN11293_c0_g1_i7.p1 TRINITY_DN11293_c0_g1~~TRINITY_DN11293_c0_g1_i7.p1  ORF type:complete len:171 (-),score=2.43 TRINITY_DN11293_c0_g1_i7:247-759(-)